MMASRWALACLLIALPATAQVASVPYTDNFEATTWPGPEWAIAYSVPTAGRIQRLTPSPLSPQGGLAVNFDVSLTNTYSTDELTLTVNLQASGGGILKYWAKETADETDAQDGCFINDGISATWVKIVDHSILTAAWQEFTIDLGTVAPANGLQITSAFKVKFSQRDNNPTPSDGLQIDAVRIQLPPVPDTGEANSASAFLDVNGGLNLLGQLSANGIHGPFFATRSVGAALTFTVKGQANQPFVLLAGPLHRNAFVIPGVGSLDLGNLGPGNLGDLFVVIDGTAAGFLNSLANTGPTGQSVISLAVPTVPAGIWASFQAAVFAGPTTVILTAATQITVN